MSTSPKKPAKNYRAVTAADNTPAVVFFKNYRALDGDPSKIYRALAEQTTTPSILQKIIGGRLMVTPRKFIGRSPNRQHPTSILQNLSGARQTDNTHPVNSSKFIGRSPNRQHPVNSPKIIGHPYINNTQILSGATILSNRIGIGRE